MRWIDGWSLWDEAPVAVNIFMISHNSKWLDESNLYEP